MAGEDYWLATSVADGSKPPRPHSWNGAPDGAAAIVLDQLDLEEDAHEHEVSALDDTLDIPPFARMSSSSTLTPAAAIEREPPNVSPKKSRYTRLDEDEHRPTTYSSLPPSPRASDMSVPSRMLDMDDLHDVFQRQGLAELSPRKRRSSLDSADERSANEDFYPARSRRHTLEHDHGAGEAARLAKEAGYDGGGLETITSPPLSPTSLNEVEDADEVRIDDSPPNVPSEDRAGLSIWDLLRDEDAAEQWEGWIANGKWERIANFLAVPLAVEKVTMFGALLCLDGFLYNFTILPIRALFAAWSILVRLVRGQPANMIPPSHLQSLLRMLLLTLPALILGLSTDTSKMYHSVRGQDTIKLYVIFNALEIGDRLCCAFGQDVLDTLFARDTLGYASGPGRRRKREQARPFFFFTLSLGYVLVHTLIFFYMLISLNVAINSYDYTLISLLISNQFVEIKGSVFKKFEKENLFQIMCADIVERFQLGLMLVVIAIRNMIEMSGSDLAFLPRSFTRGKSLLERILSPVLFVLASEMMVDWLKHAFIAKFNHVRATVYGRFTDVLAKDVLLAGTIGSGRGRDQKRKHPILLDQSPLVARRLGIAAIPLAVLVIRMGGQAVGMIMTSTHAIDGQALESGWLWTALKWTAGILVAIIIWGCLVVLKILLGLGLLSYSALRQAGMDEREAEDKVNNFGRTAVGQNKEEIAYEKETRKYLSQAIDDLPDHSTTSTPRPPQRGGAEAAEDVAKAGKKKTWRLEEVDRWTMVKRIW
ncbi:hypothetical protein Q8F55_004174 [Vanrija albida]|uniref:DUF747-domain-containing protein n=1 Tax=Vanrija albida TaxID=181172 RepID=A0ABR3Q605_9TREE